MEILGEHASIDYVTIHSLIKSGNNFYAGAEGGVYLSTNNGMVWTKIGLNNKIVLSLAVNGNYVYAGTLDQGIFISSDNGLTWIQSGLNIQVNKVTIKNEYILQVQQNMEYMFQQIMVQTGLKLV